MISISKDKTKAVILCNCGCGDGIEFTYIDGELFITPVLEWATMTDTALRYLYFLTGHRCIVGPVISREELEDLCRWLRKIIEHWKPCIQPSPDQKWLEVHAYPLSKDDCEIVVYSRQAKGAWLLGKAKESREGILNRKEAAEMLFRLERALHKQPKDLI